MLSLSTIAKHTQSLQHSRLCCGHYLLRHDSTNLNASNLILLSFLAYCNLIVNAFPPIQFIPNTQPHARGPCVRIPPVEAVWSAVINDERRLTKHWTCQRTADGQPPSPSNNPSRLSVALVHGSKVIHHFSPAMFLKHSLKDGGRCHRLESHWERKGLWKSSEGLESIGSTWPRRRQLLSEAKALRLVQRL